MNVVTLAVAAVVVLAGIIFSRINRDEINLPQENEEEVLSESVDVTPTPFASPKPIGSEPQDRRPTAEAGTPTQSTFNSNILNYKYPNSQLISTSSNSLSAESGDGSDVITNWYKERINEQGMNIKTFVNTKTNDKILNKLVGADGDKEISVEISKENAASTVKISITIIEK